MFGLYHIKLSSYMGFVEVGSICTQEMFVNNAERQKDVNLR